MNFSVNCNHSILCKCFNLNFNWKIFNSLENKYPRTYFQEINTFQTFTHENARIPHGKCLNLIFIANKNLGQFENVRVKFQNIQVQLKTCYNWVTHFEYSCWCLVASKHLIGWWITIKFVVWSFFGNLTSLHLLWLHYHAIRKTSQFMKEKFDH